MIDVTLAHASGQFSDTAAEHRHDARAIFEFCTARDVWAVTGTEAGRRAGADLRAALEDAGHRHGFHVFCHPFGEWVALSHAHLYGITHGYAGPFIEGRKNPGGHMPRGIAWQAAAPRDHDLGRITVGAAHWLTSRSIEAGGVDNRRMVKGSRLWAGRHGRGSGVVFLNGDANEDDARRDIFRGDPFTTLADELGRHPATHGRRAIDFLASYDPDGRVAGKGYRVAAGLDLASDHRLIVGRFAVRPRG